MKYKAHFFAHLPALDLIVISFPTEQEKEEERDKTCIYSIIIFYLPA